MQPYLRVFNMYPCRVCIDSFLYDNLQLSIIKLIFQITSLKSERYNNNCYRAVTILSILMQFHIFINTVKPVRCDLCIYFSDIEYYIWHSIFYMALHISCAFSAWKGKHLERSYKFMKENKHSSYPFNNRTRWHCLAWKTRYLLAMSQISRNISDISCWDTLYNEFCLALSSTARLRIF